ncbi:MAG TPA: DUF2318 domain-containing protein [Geobacteraceae bacterium]
MLSLPYKMIPFLLSWGAMLLVLLRRFSAHRRTAIAAGIVGYACGEAGAWLLFHLYSAEVAVGVMKSAVGVGFLLLWSAAVIAIYRSTGRGFPSWGESVGRTKVFAGGIALAAGVLMGGIVACRLAGTGSGTIACFVAALAAVVLAGAAFVVEEKLPDLFTVSPAGAMAALVSLLLFTSSSIIRLDLFAPLSMKVMKFAHDFVHQFFESMLIPDHLFIRSYLWGYIGLLFGKGVGFWGALAIWFIPVLLILLSVNLERLPPVAHIRQGAKRRKMVAAAIENRRLRLVVPALSCVVFSLAVYRSTFPAVEYWDPKPVPVTAAANGEIVIPKKGEVDLEDGKLHKFLYRQNGNQARFMAVMTPEGKLTVVLDACAICKPDGYGQAEGSVVCYYCKTLIPMDTVGKPGGCNPVPVPFTEKEDGVHLDAVALVNTWTTTVQSTTRVKEEGK